MSIQAILLRILNNAPLVTKGDKLTSSEIDTNFIEIFNELILISNPINVTAYDNGVTYVGGSETLAAFSSELWRFISATDRTGISPGSDPEVWNRESTNRLAHEDVNLVTLTRTELLALQVAGTIHPSRLYKISDRDIYLFGITTSLVSSEGVLLARNADYQNVGGNNLGVWTAQVDDGSPGLQQNDIVIYNGLQFKSLTGNTSPVLSPPNDPANWVLVATTDSSYITEIDSIHYDLANDVIIRRIDKRGNKVQTENSFIDSSSPPLNPIDVFQWGNDNVIGNSIGDNSILSCLNNLQSIKYNKLQNADVTADMVTKNLERSSFVDGVEDVSASLSDVTDKNQILPFKKTILSADVLQLNSIRQLLIPAPGVGRAILLYHPSSRLVGVVTPYDTNTIMLLISDTADLEQAQDNSLLASNVNTHGRFQNAGSPANETQITENEAVFLTVKNGDPDNGDGDLTIYGSYEIINL